MAKGVKRKTCRFITLTNYVKLWTPRGFPHRYLLTDWQLATEQLVRLTYHVGIVSLIPVAR